MIKIEVFICDNSWRNYISNPEKYIKSKTKYLNNSLVNLKKKNFNFSVLLGGNKEIRTLNRKFRKKNKTTDVLSFPFQTKKELNKKLKKEKEVYLGDIIINLNKIKGKKMIKKFLIEFDRLWIHGLVHLFGYQHEREKDYLKMSKVEKKFLNLIKNGKVS